MENMETRAKIKSNIGAILIILVVSTYFLANTIHYSYQPELNSLTDSATGYGTDPIHVPGKTFPALFFSYILYLVLAGGGIAFMAFFMEYKRFKLFWLVILSFILFICYTMPTRMVHGRYLDPFIPLMIIGALAYQTRTKKKESYLILAFTLSLISLWFFPFFWMDTINSSTNIYFLCSYTRYILIVVFFAFFLFLLEARDTRKISAIVASTFIILFLANNTINYQYVVNASTNAYEYCEIGRYISEEGLTGVYFDEDDYKDWWSTYCLINFWNKQFTPLENFTDASNSSRYFISSKKLPYPILSIEKSFKKLENANTTLYLYQVNKNEKNEETFINRTKIIE